MAHLRFMQGFDVTIEVASGGFVYYEDAKQCLYANWEDLTPDLQRSLERMSSEIVKRGKHLADRSVVAALRAGADPSMVFERYPDPPEDVVKAQRAVSLFRVESECPFREGGFSAPGFRMIG